MIPYLIGFHYKIGVIFSLEDKNNVFYFSCLSLTIVTLFLLGVVKSKFSIRSWWYSGTETCILGAFVAFIGYLIAILIEP